MFDCDYCHSKYNIIINGFQLKIVMFGQLNSNSVPLILVLSGKHKMQNENDSI